MGDAMDRKASGGQVPPDPLGGIGIAEFGAALRAGRTSAEAATRAYLARITAVEPRIGCFLHVAQDAALASARAMDALLRAGTDLGPLMGVPVAVKDLFFVDGMPTRAGSDIDVSDLVGPEAGMVLRLRRLGAVIIGKARQSEFAFAANLRKDAPWNPWDARTKRMAGTSSGGSAVAMASRFAAFTLGSDAGGSVRQPAALNGVVGYKATVGFLPTDGARAVGVARRAADRAARAARPAPRPRSPLRPRHGVARGRRPFRRRARRAPARRGRAGPDVDPRRRRDPAHGGPTGAGGDGRLLRRGAAARQSRPDRPGGVGAHRPGAGGERA
jgi:aspartyl-tRNA(Asn)/glutamyl-tRNA(Gln) amidotransferase subunit A